MEIIEYNSKYEENIKDLLVELQQYIVKIDKFKLNILGENYREQYFKKTLEEVYSNNGKLYVAVENGGVLGFICGFVRNYTEEDKLDYLCPKIGVISELIVSKNSRQGGVGKELLETMENYLKSISCKYITIEVFAYNEVARKFYDKYGYEDRCINLFKKI